MTGDDVRVKAEASDPDGDDLWYRYEWSIGGVVQEGTIPKLSLAGVERGEHVSVRVVASDGRSESRPVTRDFRVENSPPRLLKVDLSPSREVVAGVELVARPDARDADGDRLQFRYEWSVNGRVTGETGPEFETAELERGDLVELSVVAFDEYDESEALSSPKLPVVNSAPRITSRPEPAAEDGAFRYQVRAEDADGDRDLRFSLEDAPQGMSINAMTGEIHWRPTPSQAGQFRIAVIADDLHGGRARQIFEVKVGAEGAAPAPAAPGR